MALDDQKEVGRGPWEQRTSGRWRAEPEALDEAEVLWNGVPQGHGQRKQSGGKERGDSLDLFVWSLSRVQLYCTPLPALWIPEF